MGRTRGRQGPRMSAASEFYDEYSDFSCRRWKAKPKVEDMTGNRRATAPEHLQSSCGDTPEKARIAIADALNLRVRASSCGRHEVTTAGQVLLSLIKKEACSDAATHIASEQASEIIEENLEEPNAGDLASETFQADPGNEIEYRFSNIRAEASKLPSASSHRAERVALESLLVSQQSSRMLAEEVGDNSDLASVSTDVVEGCSWWGDSSVYNTDVEQPSLEAEETVEGPDGELYEVFYPPDCIPEAACKAYSDIVDNASNEEYGQQERPQDWEIDETARPTLAREFCAEDGLENIVNFMSWSAATTYPARVKLFRMVQDAAMEALGNHFQRFVLVGSTALRIDTPYSDLDAVVFTQRVSDEDVAPMPAQALRLITHALRAFNQEVEVQLVDCARVPVLTVFMQGSAISLDLTVDEMVGECHVLWFQSLQKGASEWPVSMYQVPDPSECGWSHGLEAATLRCVKWWLRRRKIPLPREGGFPSIAWTLMVLHALRCSVLVNDAEDRGNRYRVLLCALAAFFDRFSEGGVAGSLFFTVCAGAGFLPHMHRPENGETQRGLPLANLSVLDPATTNESCMDSGIPPTELAPQTSTATQLLYAYELRRAQVLSAAALIKADPDDHDASVCEWRDGSALQELFADVDDRMNVLLVSMPTALSGVIVLRENTLHLGILQQVHPKRGWRAPFLHRRDSSSSIALVLCSVDIETGILTPFACEGLEWFRPSEFVCMAPLQFQATGELKLDDEPWHRWREMHSLLHVESLAGSYGTCPEPENPLSKKKHARGKRRYPNQHHKVTERV